MKPAATDRDLFTSFFVCWISQQHRDLLALLSAAAAASSSSQETGGHHLLRSVVDTVLGHYEYYYRAKSASARCDVLPMFSPTWTNPTENLFLWVGGSRPSTAFHVLYSKSSLQLQPFLSDPIQSFGSADLAGLSPVQLDRVDRLQRETVRAERAISEEEAGAQEKLASSTTVETTTSDKKNVMEEVMRGRMESMAVVLESADKLRLETLRKVVDILRPLQAVHFLIAVAELSLSVHEFGNRVINSVDDEKAAAGRAD